MKKIFLTTVLSLTLVFFISGAIFAQTIKEGECGLDDKGQEVCKLENPLSSGTSVSGIISVVIKAALGIIGAVTLLMLVWGGFQWLTSAGNPEKVKMGTQTMLWAIVGVVLVFTSYILLATFTNYLTGGA